MRKAIFISVLVIILAVSGYVYWYYFNVYSEGYREGVLQKFSKKGDVFKTYEGEMIQLGFKNSGTAINSQYFFFSVDNDRLADTLEKSLGKVVKLHYRQYRRNVPWRGDNNDDKNADKGQYIVDGIAEVKEMQY